jgi:hypothetical protein
LGEEADMSGMTIREFTCSLCGQSYLKSSGDLMVPTPDLCDACWKEVWDMEDQALTEYVVSCLAEKESAPGQELGAPDEGQAAVDEIVKYIRSHTEHYGEVDEVIQMREWGRRLFGG